MPLRFALVGGGKISQTHIRAATLSGRATLAAGCFSRDAAKNAAVAGQYSVPAERTYPDFETMARAEAQRADRPDFVVVTTPNASHFDACRAFMAQGFPVVCDKPLTTGADKADELAALASSLHLACMTSYTFLGAPGVRALRALYDSGRFGKAFFLTLKYLRGARLNDVMGDPHSVWRFEPDLSGRAGAVGDLGSHLESLARCVAGPPDSVLARLVCEPNGIALDATASVLFTTAGGLDGSMQIGQLACGHENEVELELWCERGSLSWSFASPDSVRVHHADGRSESIAAGEWGSALADVPIDPDPYVTCFQRLYEAYFAALDGAPADGRPWFPTFADGAAGVHFIDACVDSHEQGNRWVRVGSPADGGR